MIQLVNKVDGYGPLFGIGTSPIGLIAKSYDGKVYINETVFDARMRYRNC